MPSLASCRRCQGFVADAARACPHCDAAPPRWGRLVRALSTAVLGAVSIVTLMACYGAMPSEYDCQYGDCDEPCASDDECLSGEYCWPGADCEWSGTCSVDLQCPADMFCDPARGTCRPGARAGCDDHYECVLPAERCDPLTGGCVATTACGGGLPGCGEAERCDFGYGICVPCEGDDCGACDGEVTCEAAPPSCADGSRPAVHGFGCYTGGCLTDATCAAQACAALDEPTCDASDACTPVYGGVNCSNPDGGPCGGGGPCTCESFVYLDCVVAPTAEP